MFGDGDGPRGRGNGRGWGGADGPWSGMHDGMGWGGWLLMLLLLLLLAGLVVGVVLVLLRSAGTGGPSPVRPPEADGPGLASGAGALLDERYARGEIEEDEYLHRRAVLRGS